MRISHHLNWKSKCGLLVAGAMLIMSFMLPQRKPVLYIIGDSTVQNNDGNGRNDYWGWGTPFKTYLDTNKISLRNHAKSGTSTRTFLSDGRWDAVLRDLQPGDFVIIQFGHNDASPINDTARARGTLEGIGDEVKDVINAKTHQPETVHTYGWYLTKIITEAQQKGALAIVCSLVPRERWEDKKVVSESNYVTWAQQVAQQKNAWFVNLNDLVIHHWEEMGADSVRNFFPGDHTHTNLKGAQLNALSFREGIQAQAQCPLNNYISK